MTGSISSVIDKASGKFRSRDGLSAPMGLGYEYLDGNAADKTTLPSGVIVYGNSYDMREDAVAAAAQALKDTIPLQARKGRASYLGERSIGHQDPGATSSYLILNALLTALKD